MGSTPKQTISHKESIWIPKLSSSSVRFFLVLAIFPSNMSQNPEKARKKIAHCSCLELAQKIPATADTKLIYVSITV